MSNQELITELNNLFSNKVGNEDYKVVEGDWDDCGCDIHIFAEFCCNDKHNCRLHYGCHICQEFQDLEEKYGYEFDWINCCVAGLWKKSEKQIKNEKMNEMLNNNFRRRKNALEKYLPFLNTTLRKGKGINSRKRFLHFIKFGANTNFDNEEKEYNFIGKFGRGLWSEEFICKKAFYTKEEEDTIIELAKEYGAFDY